MQEIVLLDAQTARVLSEIQVASSDVELSEDDVVLLNKDIETLFDEPLFLDSNLEGGSLVDTLHKRLSVDDKPVQNASGDWNFILIRAKSGANVSKIIDELNIKIDPYGSSAVGWRTAAGLAAILVLLLQALYNAGIMIVCAAGIIAIINILLISVFRRTREIGTMRAMGADDKTIRSLLFIENCSLGFLGGIFGIVLGSIAFAVINVMNISVHNDLLAGLLGGSVLHIDFYFGTAALAVLFSLVLSFLSLIIPAETAVRIEPVVAVREG
jgi:ABC-type lipoprotein release transport system permease subunit